MLATTIDATRALFRADPSLTPEDRARLLALLRNHSKTYQESSPAENRIIRRAEAARLLARTPRSVDHMAAEGILEKVQLPGRRRAAGFRLADVQALIGAKGAA